MPAFIISFSQLLAFLALAMACCQAVASLQVWTVAQLCLYSSTAAAATALDSTLSLRMMRTRGGGGIGIGQRVADGPPAAVLSGVGNHNQSPAASASSANDCTGVGAARVSLLAVAGLFGTLNVCLRLIYSLPHAPAPPVVGLIRGIFTALCFAPSLARLILQGRSSSGDLWSAAFWLGLWNVLSQGLLTVGLTMTSSSVRASFLAQSSVVITPVISVLLGGQTVKPSVWAGAVVAMVGLIVLTSGNANSGGDGLGGVSGTNAGDLLVLGCALCWSMYLFQFGRIAHRYDKVSLQSATCAIRALMYVAWYFVAGLIRHMTATVSAGGMHGLGETLQSMWLGWRDLRAWGLLLFSAVGSGALAGVLQQKGQATLSASEANIILSSEPIWAGLCAWLLLGELLSPRENIGGLIIFFATIVASGALDGLVPIMKIRARSKAKSSSHPPDEL